VTLKACVVCGTPTRLGPRCELHQLRKHSRSRAFRRTAALIIANATECGRCHKPFSNPADPPVVDHIVAVAHGGSDDPSNLMASHRSCNGRHGALLIV
jgi:5-methylcytosine-specific restriction endonuclease McrA